MALTRLGQPMSADPMDDGSGPGALVYLVNPKAHRLDRNYEAEIECPPIFGGCGWKSRVMGVTQAHQLRPLHACFSPRCTPAVRCSVENCGRLAVTVLAFVRQLGHVHVCANDEAIDREWCDVTSSAPLIAGSCPWPCTPMLYTTEPTALTP